MFINDKRIDEVGEADLQALVSAGVLEAKRIEYKLNLPGSTDNDKKEFLADVSSLANSSGGDIVFGMREEKGAATELIGFPSNKVDLEKRRLEDIIRNGIDRRIPNLTVHTVPLANDRVALLIRVPRSLMGPHMVAFKGSSRFYARNSAGKYQLDISELRAAFLASETFAEKAREFRVERISRIQASETPVPLKPSPIAVLHLLPIGAFEFNARRDVSALAGKPENLRPLLSHGSYSAPRHNFDGLISHNTSQGEVDSYVQLFRGGGIIEAVLADLNDTGDVNRKFLPIRWLEDTLIEALPLYLEAQRKIGVEEPVFIILSLLGVKGYVLGVPNWYRVNQSPIDRNTILIPEILIENREEKSEILLRPVFDVIWNAAGWARSMHYDRDGNRLAQ